MFWRKSNGHGDTGRKGREDMEKSGISPAKNWGNLGFLPKTGISPAKNWENGISSSKHGEHGGY